MAIQYIFNPFTGNFDAINNDSSPMTFTLVNNQTSFADITEFLIDPSVSHAFTAEISIERQTDTPIDLITQQTIKGVYHSSTTSWQLSPTNAVGDDVGVQLQMTDLGQLQYTSTNLSGTITISEMKFTILEL